jgi:hypothetical protein
MTALDSFTRLYGGIYLPKRPLDRWATSTAKSLRNIVLFGDSLTQGGASAGKRNAADGVTTINSPVVTSATILFTAKDVGSKLFGTGIPVTSVIVSVDSATQVTIDRACTASATGVTITVCPDNFSDILRNYLSNFSPVHAGFYGLWRGDFLASWAPTGGDQDWLHSKSWVPSIVANTYDFAPFLQAYTSPATAPTVVALVGATMSTTSGSTAVTFSAAVTNLSSSSVGCLIMGSGIPANAVVTAVADTTHITISQAATATATAQDFRIEGPHAMWTRPPDVTVAQIDVWWIDHAATTPSWSYSTDGGATWTTVAQTGANPPILNKTSIATTNPASLLIRGYAADGAPNVIGTFGRVCLVGVVVYSSTPPSGFAVHNVGMSAQSLNSACHCYTVRDLVVTNGSPTATSATAHFKSWQTNKRVAGANIVAGTTYTVVNDSTITMNNNATGSGTVTATIGSASVASNAWLSNGLAGTCPGIKPDLLVVLFTNDAASFSDAARFTDTLTQVYNEVHPYCDIVVMNAYQQNGSLASPGRARDLTAVVTNGTATVTCASGAFTAQDVGLSVSGTNIPTNAANGAAVIIASVTSSTTVVLSAAATGSSSTGTLTIDRSAINQSNYRAAVQAWCATNNVACVDLYDQYAAQIGTAGYAAANADGLHQDIVHPSRLGHSAIGNTLIRALSLASAV